MLILLRILKRESDPVEKHDDYGIEPLKCYFDKTFIPLK
jgi:hypothetical protein